MKTLHELMTTGAEQEMIESEIYDQLIQSAKDALIARQKVARVFGPNDIPGSSIDVVYADKDSMTVRKVAEGAEIPISVEKYSTFNLKPDKYGLRPLITKEMIEDNKWNIIQQNINQAGYEVAEHADGLILSQLTTGAQANSTNHESTTGSAQSIAKLTSVMRYIEEDGYNPDTLFVDDYSLYDLRNIDTFVEADKLGNREMLQTGMVGRVYGLDVFFSPNITDKYAYIFDSRWALCLAEKRPLTLQKYNDDIRDMVGVSITTRFKERYLIKEACGQSYYS